MAAFQIQPPDNFDFSCPPVWHKWIKCFERFREASDLFKADEAKQISTLVYTMGDRAEDILASFNLSADDVKKYDIVKQRFDEHFVIKRNVIYE
ncbi:Uncharacterised protein r2_g3547 [Pycnogonum litorale]